MAQTLNDFMGAFKGGLRPNKFLVTVTKPALAGNLPSFTYHCRAASMPASTMTTINVPYRGRIYKMPGIRTYATWQMTILDDNNNIFGALHAWSEIIKGHVSNTTKATDADFSDVMGTLEVQQLGYNGKTFRKMILEKAWPSNIGPIALDMENNENIITFTVDFEYQYLKVADDAPTTTTQSDNPGAAR